MRTIIKRAGVIATLFFLIKGLVWLALLAGAAGWAGSAGAAGPLSGPRQSAPLPQQRQADTSSAPVPLGIARAARTLADLGTAAVGGQSRATIVATCVALSALSASLVAMRLAHRREGRSAGAGSIDSISRSTAGRTARAASFRPCV